MSDGNDEAGAATTQDRPSDEEMRAAYEAELNRITSVEMILQTAVSLINIGGRRLGLTPPPSDSSTAPIGSPPAGERDLEQVRDAIDAAGALLPVLERRMPREIGPLRDAIAQLQVAYAREAQNAGATAGGATTSSTARASTPEPTVPAEKREKAAEDEQQQGPGPAQSSGRLWVPGR
jgi:hypothetical protein